MSPFPPRAPFPPPFPPFPGYADWRGGEFDTSHLAAPTGFEPVISWMKTKRPKPG